MSTEPETVDPSTTDDPAVKAALRVAESVKIRPIVDEPLPSAQSGEVETVEPRYTSDDRAGFHALDLAFHEALVQGLGLTRIAAVIERSRANVDRVRRLLSSPRRHALTLAEHRRIFAAVAARDPAAARQAMEAHLDAVTAELDQLSVERPEIFTR